MPQSRDASGTTTYTYDTTNRLKHKVTPAGGLNYSYDAANNISETFADNFNSGGVDTRYTYDGLNRMSTAVAISDVGAVGNITTSYTYDAVGDLATVAYPNGVTHTYTYNNLNRLTNLAVSCGTTAPGCTTNSANYAYTLGPAGNRTSVTELGGRTVTYGYDDLYRLTSETIAGAASQNGSIGYVYDAVGNRQSLSSTVAAIPAGTLFYDANDRLSTDIYDNDGNTVSSGSIRNVYDFENHLVQHGAVTIIYDGDGNRVAKTAGGVTTKYLVDTNSVTGYAQVLEELNSSGAVTRKYTYGLQLISENQLIGSTQTVTFYGYDGHGSVRQLTDRNGAVTDTYTYDAFGNILTTTGSTPNNFKFAGQQFDADFGLYYNRARYLDVRQGRFWGMDTWEGAANAPTSTHRYAYTADSPSNSIDPSGKFGIEDAAVVSAAVGVLVAITTIGVGQLAYRTTDKGLRGTLVHEAIYPFYRAAGFTCNQAIGTIGNEPIDLARPDCRHEGQVFPFGPTPFTGEVYEIKSNDPGQIALGEEEVLGYYIPRLSAHSPNIPWHPGFTLLAPLRLRIPAFPYVVFNLSIPVPGVISYDPEADYETAAKYGLTAAALTFLLLELKFPAPEPVPVPNPTPEPLPNPGLQPAPAY